jgi:hypothetical protein
VSPAPEAGRATIEVTVTVDGETLSFDDETPENPPVEGPRAEPAADDEARIEQITTQFGSDYAEALDARSGGTISGRLLQFLAAHQHVRPSKRTRP